MKTIIASLLSLTLLVACSKDDPAAVHANEMAASAKQWAADFQKSASAKLDSVGKTLEDLKAKAATVAEEKKPEFDKAMASLEAKRKELGNKLAELTATGTEKAKALAADIERELEELRKKAEAELDKLK